MGKCLPGSIRVSETLSRGFVLRYVLKALGRHHPAFQLGGSRFSQTTERQTIAKAIWIAPKIYKEVEELIRSCIPCQASGTGNHPGPLKINELPPKPWYTVHVDFCSLFPTGECILVVIDAYARFPEVEIVNLPLVGCFHHSKI